MSYEVKLLPVVHKDLKEAKIWYNSQQVLLGEEFKLEVNKAIEYLARNPEHFQLKYKELQSPVSRFPFAVYYLLEENKKQIIIVGVFHTSRNPEIIKTRTP